MKPHDSSSGSQPAPVVRNNEASASSGRISPSQNEECPVHGVEMMFDSTQRQKPNSPTIASPENSSSSQHDKRHISGEEMVGFGERQTNAPTDKQAETSPVDTNVHTRPVKGSTGIQESENAVPKRTTQRRTGFRITRRRGKKEKKIPDITPNDSLKDIDEGTYSENEEKKIPDITPNDSLKDIDEGTYSENEDFEDPPVSGDDRYRGNTSSPQHETRTLSDVETAVPKKATRGLKGFVGSIIGHSQPVGDEGMLDVGEGQEPIGDEEMLDGDISLFQNEEHASTVRKVWTSALDTDEPTPVHVSTLIEEPENASTDSQVEPSALNTSLPTTAEATSRENNAPTDSQVDPSAVNTRVPTTAEATSHEDHDTVIRRRARRIYIAVPRENLNRNGTRKDYSGLSVPEKRKRKRPDLKSRDSGSGTLTLTLTKDQNESNMRNVRQKTHGRRPESVLTSLRVPLSFTHNVIPEETIQTQSTSASTRVESPPSNFANTMSETDDICEVTLNTIPQESTSANANTNNGTSEGASSSRDPQAPNVTVEPLGTQIFIRGLEDGRRYLLEDLLEGRTRREAASLFYEASVLASESIINMEQDENGNVYVSKRML